MFVFMSVVFGLILLFVAFCVGASAAGVDADQWLRGNNAGIEAVIEDIESFLAELKKDYGYEEEEEEEDE